VTTPHELTITPAKPTDAGLLLTLVRELAVYEKLADDVVATEGMMREALFGPDRAAEAVVARWDGEPAGFAIFFHNFSTFLGRSGLYLEDLFVRPALRGRGIGLGLMRHLAGLAVEVGCGRFEWSVLNWNQPAIEFYESLGAKAMNTWTVFRVDGDALLRLSQAKT